MSKGKLLAVCVLWLVIAGIAAMAWRWLVVPRRIESTGSDPHFQHHLYLALDSFSGYAILRSPSFHSYLTEKRIKVELQDDGANYRQRIQSLRRGDVQLAAFTIDALIKVSGDLDQLPATIVAIIDETRGADALVADSRVAANLDALNRADVRFVLTPDSPSETLARVVMADFHLDNLPRDPFIPAKDAQDVVAKYRASRKDAPHVYVLWEPYVSQILENSNMKKLIDSSRFRGYIVDVLVANRDYLLKNRDVVRDIVGCYFRAAYQHRDQMDQLVLEDARQLNAPVNQSAAAALVQGIWWKNTQENFAHMGLAGAQPLQHVEDIIDNITEVLIKTGAVARDPTGGQPHLLYFKETLQELQASNFHPALGAETVRDDAAALPALSSEEWEQLVKVGTLEVPQLVFARGSARLTSHSQGVLDDLAEKLNTWPQYYVLIRGNASTQGDLQSNRQLASNRAKEAEEYLIGRGIDQNRVRAVATEPSGSTSVSFLLGQPPY